MNWIALLKEWQDLAGAIIGGLVTYLALMLTFRYQAKNEYPKKLITVSKIAFNLQEYYGRLGLYIHRLRFNEFDEELASNLRFIEFREQLLLLAADTDKETYKVISKAFEKFKDMEYFSIFVVTDNNRKKVITKAGEFRTGIEELMRDVKKRVEYFEKRI